MDVTGPKLSLNNFRPWKPSSKPVHEFDVNSKLKIKSYLKLKKKSQGKVTITRNSVSCHIHLADTKPL